VRAAATNGACDIETVSVYRSASADCAEESMNLVEEQIRPIASSASPAKSVRLGLAMRLLILIIGIVMLAEAAVYVPFIVNYRNAWLRGRLAAAYTAALAFEAAPGPVSDQLTRRVLASVGARTIVLQLSDNRRLIAATDMPNQVDDVEDLRDSTYLQDAASAFETMFASPDRVMRAIGDAPPGVEYVEITLDEGPLRAAMLSYSARVLLASLVVSLAVAAVAATALHLMVLGPMRRLTSSIIAFGADPEDPTRIIRASRATHEIGVAERALAIMQEELLHELQQNKRLAALGLAVAKINHDLRNMLAPAQLLTDRLAGVSDPLVRRLGPKLVATIDRATQFCQSTLAYGRAAERSARPTRVEIRSLVSDAAETVSPAGVGVVPIRNEAPKGLETLADAEQLFRVLMNLLRNAVDALESAGPQPGRDACVRVRARRSRGGITIEVSDNGPGMPARAKEHLFEAFQGSTRPGGTGLGLAIAAELVRAQHGTIRLEEPPEGGACFVVELPEAEANAASDPPRAGA
jgi:signal transduction histidine kinase